MNLSHVRRKLFGLAARRPIVARASRLTVLALEDRVVPANFLNTLDENGINALGLGLTGAGVRIGQVEPNRPGDPGFDLQAANARIEIDPARVSYTNKPATADNASEIRAGNNDHAAKVASIMIGDWAGTYTGVAPDAKLYSSAVDNGTEAFDTANKRRVRARQALEEIAIPVRGQPTAAINNSFGVSRRLLIDDTAYGGSWLSRAADFTIYGLRTINVVSTPNDAGQARDRALDMTYNAIKVRALEQDRAGVFRQTTLQDVSQVYTLGDRAYVELLAPGRDVGALPQARGSMPVSVTGTSFASPHVTGAIALLHEHVNKSGLPVAAKNPYLMKAVLLNSADKIKGRLPGPDPVNAGQVITMGRTVLDDAKRSWDQDPAADILGAADADQRQRNALSKTLGAGALNVRRAVTQLNGGQYAPGNNAVGAIGWNLNALSRNDDPAPDATTGLQNFQRYKVYHLPQLKPGSDLSVTLAWAREVVPTKGPVLLEDYEVINGFRANDLPANLQAATDYLPRNLDLYLVPAGKTSIRDAVWSSRSIAGNVEQFFLQLPADKGVQYDLWVVGNMSTEAAGQAQSVDNRGVTQVRQEYGLAWWGESTKPGGGGNPQGSIGDKVWDDANANGIQDTGEAGVRDVDVTLIDATTLEAVDETRTDHSGGYLFANVAPGDYIVRFDAPFGYRFTNANRGGDDNVDSDAVASPGAAIAFTDRVTITNFFDERLDVDAGLVLKPRTSSVGDRVWRDTNANGVQDSGEAGVAGVTVTLFTAAGDFLAEAVTNSSGSYQFTALPAEQYYLEFAARGPYDRFTTQDVGTADAADSDADAGGRTAVFALAEGEQRIDIDAGLLEPTVGSIGDYVWDDRNRNGVQDAGEDGLGGVRVNLYSSTGTLVAWTDTDPDGYYQFADIAAGNYYVRVEAPTGYQFTLQNAGPDDTDSDAGGSGQTYVFALTAGEVLADLDVGLYSGSIGDYVWYDSDRDGVQDAGEYGLGGVTVNLLNGSGGVVASTLSESDGYYSFGGLGAGTYEVQFVAPTGYSFSPANATADDRDSDADPYSGRTGTITLTAGEQRTYLDAGLYSGSGGSGGSIGDYVWYDSDRDGVQDTDEFGEAGVTVNLRDGFGNLVASTTTDAYGHYSFAGLGAGTYEVQFVAPSGSSFSPQNATTDDLDSDAAPSTGRTGTFALAAGEQRTDLDAGLTGSGGSGGSVGDYVWDDANANGVQDAGEYGRSGVTVNLLNGSGGVVASTTTDSYGHYSFGGLGAGTYEVEFVAPYGATFSPANATADDRDSDAGAGGRTGTFTLAAGQQRMDVDAGLYGSGGSGGSGGRIGDWVWADADRDGVQDAGEYGFAGATVNLRNTAGALLASATSDSSGYYSFAGLGAGTYQVEFVAPSGYSLSTPATRTVTLSTGQTVLDADAGVYGSGGSGGSGGSIGDYVWNDADRNGVQDAGEYGQSGVTVNLRNGSGGVLSSTTSDSYGHYSFGGLGAGTYQVEFVPPAGYSLSTPGTRTVALAAGQAYADADAGVYGSGGSGGSGGMIGDFVWSDSDRDGVQDAGEYGYGGATVYLRDGGGNLLSSTTSDSYGYYSFGGLGAGTYQVQFVAPSGYSLSTAGTRTVTLAPGEQRTDIDAGVYGSGGSGGSGGYMGVAMWQDPEANTTSDTASAAGGEQTQIASAGRTAVPMVPTDAAQTAAGSEPAASDDLEELAWSGVYVGDPVWVGPEDPLLV